MIKRLVAQPALLLIVYPTWFMWPCLLPGTNSMLQYASYLDTSGTVSFAQSLSRMATPWSWNYFNNAPIGESFWNPTKAVQGIHWLVFWIETRVMSPVLAVNVFIWLGWVLSGIAGYKLARYLKMSMFSAVFVGLLIEILPWVREKALTHVSYVFLCLPLFCVVLALKCFDAPSRRNALNLLGFVMFLSVFDLYWFYMCICLIISISIMHYKSIFVSWSRLNPKAKLATLPITLIGCLLIKGIYTVLARATMSSVTSNRPLSIASNIFIDLSNGSLMRFVRPTIGHVFVREGWLSMPPISEDFVTYGGITVLLLASCSVLFAKRALFSRYPHFVGLYVVAFLLALFTLPTTLDTPLGEFAGPVSYLKYVTPGMRVYSRFGMISQVLLCVIAGFAVDVLCRTGMKKILRICTVGVVVLLCLIDLNPFARRLLTDDYKEYDAIRHVLSTELGAVAYEIAPDLDEWYFPAHYIDAPQLFTRLNRYWNQDFELQASRGEQNFANYLRSRGVTHVLIPVIGDTFDGYRKKWGVFGSINLSLNASDFTEVAQAGGRYPAKLFQIRAREEKVFCEACSRYRLNWSGVRTSFYSQLYVDSKQIYEDGSDLSWVLPKENPEVTLVSDAPVGTKFEITFSLTPAYGGQAQPQIVRFESGLKSELVRLMPGGPTKYSVLVESGQSVLLKRFLPCTVPAFHEPGNPDTRAICYAITSLQVKQVVP
jgi:hypothetical protein